MMSFTNAAKAGPLVPYWVDSPRCNLGKEYLIFDCGASEL